VDTLKQLFREFRLPFLLAGGWTGFAVYKSPTPATITSVITIFGSAFFLISWATGQINRVRKQTHVDTNLENIQSRLEVLLTQLETRTAEIVGQITGGESFCHATFMIDNNSNLAQVMVLNGSKHPVFDAHLRITDLDCLDKAAISNNPAVFASCSVGFGVPVLTGSHGTIVGQLALGDGPVRRFNIFWTARNGDHTQLLRLIKVNGIWRQATRVVRGGDLLLEQIVPDFPRDILGTEWTSIIGKPP
jgi:hypothetical protein